MRGLVLLLFSATLTARESNPLAGNHDAAETNIFTFGLFEKAKR